MAPESFSCNTYKKGRYVVCEWNDGLKQWTLNGKQHREDGPAIIYPNGSVGYRLENKTYSEEEWFVEVRKRKLEAMGI